MALEEAKIAAKPGYRTPAAILRRLATAPVFYGEAEDWENFSLHHVGVKVPKLGQEAAAAKGAAEETEYLRLLQRRRDLRRKIIRLGEAAG
jgi:hypothetical protein